MARLAEGAKKLELEGVPDLLKKLKKLEMKKRGQILKRAVRNSLLPVQKLAYVKAPKGTEPHKLYTGRLVPGGFLTNRHIRRKAVITRDGRIVGLVGPTKEAFYATQFIEVGLKNKLLFSDPWLEPAFKESQSKVLNKLNMELRKIITKAIK